MSSSDRRGVYMNTSSNSTGKAFSQNFRTYGAESTNVGSSINECSECGEDRDQNFEIYDNNFGNVNASNIRQMGLQSQRKEWERGEQTASGLSYMEVEENTESSGPQFKKTLELIATIENMKELLYLSKGEVEYCLQQGTPKTLSVSGRTEQNERQHALERELERVKESETDIRKINDLLRKENASLVEQNKQEKNNLESLKRSFDEEQGKSSKQQVLFEQFAKEHAKLSNENKSLNEKLSSKTSQYDLLLEEKRKISKELSDCKTRLSRLMGNKLSDNNPDIADLSDKNRPTKLAEKYQEIYDNQWTVAFEKVEEEFHDERKSISILKELLEDIGCHCDKMAQDQKTAILESVAMKKLTDEDLPSEVIKQLKDIRKTTAEVSVKMVYEQYLDTVKQSHGANTSWLVSDSCLQPFVRGCLELCWQMSVQDPPLAFSPDPKHMEIFDSNKYKFYTRTGSLIDFVVWPPLMLHSKGPILSKGIAQACSSPDQKKEEHTKSPTEVRRGKDSVAMNDSITKQAEPSAQVIVRLANETAVKDAQDTAEVPRHPKQEESESICKPDTFKTETAPANKINKNAQAFQRYFTNHPTNEELDTFKEIGKMYGYRSLELKAALGERYEMTYNYCKKFNYHDYLDL